LSTFILYARATCVVLTIHGSLSHFSVSPAISALRNHMKLSFVQDRSPKFTNSTRARRGNSKLLALLGRTGSVNKGAAGSKFDRPISSSDITDYCWMACSES